MRAFLRYAWFEVSFLAFQLIVAAVLLITVLK